MERIFGTIGLPEAIRSDKRIAVRLDGRRWALGIVGVVAEARHRAALHPAIEASAVTSTRSVRMRRSSRRRLLRIGSRRLVLCRRAW